MRQLTNAFYIQSPRLHTAENLDLHLCLLPHNSRCNQAASVKPSDRKDSGGERIEVPRFDGFASDAPNDLRSPEVIKMGDILVALGALVAILLAIFHFLSTKKALGEFPELPSDPFRMLLGMWNGIGFMLIYLGVIPLVLVLLGAYVGTCKTVVGISAVSVAGVLAIANFIVYWPTKQPIAKVVPFIFAVIAALIAVGSFVL